MAEVEKTFVHLQIRELRLQAELTLEKLAELTGVTYSTIVRLETKAVNARVATLVTFAKVIAAELDRHPLDVFSNFFSDQALSALDKVYQHAPELNRVVPERASNVRKEAKGKFRARALTITMPGQRNYTVAMTQLQRDYGRSKLSPETLAELTGLRTTRLRIIFRGDSESTYALLTDMFLPLCAVFAALNQEALRTYLLRAVQDELLRPDESFEAYLAHQSVQH